MARTTVRDQWGNEIYITDERWAHVLERHEELMTSMMSYWKPCALEEGVRKRLIQTVIDIIDPNKVYVMGQRTKWGNCSSLQNLSFNWRLIMAPPFVMNYIVTHEVVHLLVPDHSKRFWLTLQSFCPEMDQARQWLVANGDRLMLT